MLRQLLVIMFLGLALLLPAQAAQDVFGPIKRTDTLWRIAEQLNPDKKASIQQVMLAIYEKNKHAFTVNNINSLRRDAYMLAPTVSEVNALSRKSAVNRVQRHNARWKRGRYVAIHNPVPAELTRKLTQITSPAQEVGGKASDEANSPTQTVTAAEVAVEKITATDTDTEVVESAPAAMAVPETIVDGMPLKDQLRIVMQELGKARQENQLLQAELKQAREQQQQNLAKNQPDPDIQTQLDALRHELAELRTILAQKDNHIQTLQASLKSASEAIKSQHADNMRLYNKLKELSPESVPAQAQQTDKPQITLTAVTKDALLSASEAKEDSQPVVAQVWADETAETDDNAQNNGIQQPGTSADGNMSLSQLVSNNIGLAQSGTTASGSAKSAAYTVSPVAWAAVLLSFVFILFLVIRALVVQNEISKFADED